MLILLYTLIVAVGIVAWLDLRAARRRDTPSVSAATAARLIVIEGADSDRPAGTSFLLAPVSTVGRDLDNDIVLADPTISGRHAVISRRDGRWWMEDLGSTNGSAVNSTSVEAEAPAILRSGDLIQFGAVKMRLAAPEG
jgi:pSer/pThr/pTyr-binding forkhead associated (FHA) protein